MKRKLILLATLASLLILNSSMESTRSYPVHKKNKKAATIGISVHNASTSTVTLSASGVVNFGPSTLTSGQSTSWSSTATAGSYNYFFNAQVTTTGHAAGRVRLLDNLGNVVTCQNVPASYTGVIVFPDDIYISTNTDYTLEYKQGVSCPN